MKVWILRGRNQFGMNVVQVYTTRELAKLWRKRQNSTGATLSVPVKYSPDVR